MCTKSRFRNTLYVKTFKICTLFYSCTQCLSKCCYILAVLWWLPVVMCTRKEFQCSDPRTRDNNEINAWDIPCILLRPHVSALNVNLGLTSFVYGVYNLQNSLRLTVCNWAPLRNVHITACVLVHTLAGNWGNCNIRFTICKIMGDSCNSVPPGFHWGEWNLQVIQYKKEYVN
jgi:hypothetical protein